MKSSTIGTKSERMKNGSALLVLGALVIASGIELVFGLAAAIATFCVCFGTLFIVCGIAMMWNH